MSIPASSIPVPVAFEPVPTAWLLTWNPQLAWLETIEDLVAQHDYAVSDWSTRTTKIEQGDRIYLLRQVVEPRGIVAVGDALDSPNDHGDGFYVPVLWEAMRPDRPFVSTKRLKVAFPDAHWAPRASGQRVPDYVAPRLDRMVQTAVDAAAKPTL